VHGAISRDDALSSSKRAFICGNDGMASTGHGTMTQRPELANLAMREFLERPESEKESR
jgi:hypothetical protein